MFIKRADVLCSVPSTLPAGLTRMAVALIWLPGSDWASGGTLHTALPPSSAHPEVTQHHTAQLQLHVFRRCSSRTENSSKLRKPGCLLLRRRRGLIVESEEKVVV
eukprot:TRINITY_DN6022_c0_g3_i1.p1 TRINITY_DN6022_c0_g3~~TRINITY_DN6022_c0_g3_i1.p1  ORF type:complete len:105 (-),score=5.24 TRINITY_DN6022_c0_g3_i1:48-362(-)